MAIHFALDRSTAQRLAVDPWAVCSLLRISWYK